EDAQLETTGLREACQVRHVAPAVGRPVLREDQDFLGAAGLRGQPLDGGRLLVGQSRLRVTLAEEPAPVDARADQAESPDVEPFTAEIRGRAGELHVVVE